MSETETWMLSGADLLVALVDTAEVMQIPRTWTWIAALTARARGGTIIQIHSKVAAIF